MRFIAATSVCLLGLFCALACAEATGNPAEFDALNGRGGGVGTGGAAQPGPTTSGTGGTTGDTTGGGSTSSVGSGSGSSTGGTTSSSGGTSSGSGGRGDGSSTSSGGSSTSSGGTGSGGATCGGFLQPPCGGGGAGTGGSTCGGLFQPPCGTGGMTSGDGGMDQCANEACFDIFDCFLYHPNAAMCGFTKCDGFICKP